MKSRIRFLLLSFSLSFVLLALFGTPAYAQTCGEQGGTCMDPNNCTGNIVGVTDCAVPGHILYCCVPSRWSSLAASAAPNLGGQTLGQITSTALVWLFPIAGLLLLLYLLYGGFRFMTSAGDPQAASQAKGIITTALVGFVVIFVAYWVTQIVITILGIDAGGLFLPV